jgi:hypothetical protein
MSGNLHPLDPALARWRTGHHHAELGEMAAQVARRVCGDSEAERELAEIARDAERQLLGCIDRWAARRRRERGAA